MKTGYWQWPPGSYSTACWHSFLQSLVSSFALLADPKTVNDHIAFLSEFLPQGTFSIIQDQVGRVLSKGDMKLGGTFLASLLLAWSANGGVKAIIDALNVVYDEKEKRGFFKLNAVSLAFTIAGVANAGATRQIPGASTGF
jgi:membrane protein